MRELDSTWRELVTEMVVDDALSPELASRLPAMGYPELDAAFNVPEPFAETIAMFLAREISCRYISLRQDFRLVVNGTRDIVADAAGGTIRGRCEEVAR